MALQSYEITLENILEYSTIKCITYTRHYAQAI